MQRLNKRLVINRLFEIIRAPVVGVLEIYEISAYITKRYVSIGFTYDTKKIWFWFELCSFFFNNFSKLAPKSDLHFSQYCLNPK